jgi:hypothetical protein
MLLGSKSPLDPDSVEPLSMDLKGLWSQGLKSLLGLDPR